VDSIDVVGHHQDLALWGRIDGYRPVDLESALYRRRTLFEWGGNVQIRDVRELSYLRVVMERKVAEERWRAFGTTHADAIGSVRRDLQRHGPLGSRDLTGRSETRIENYRARKVSGLALYYLWLKGDVMVASRRRGEKLFDLTSRLLPETGRPSTVPEAEAHLILETLGRLGLATSSEWLRHARGAIGRSTLRDDWSGWLRRWQETGVVQDVEVEGQSGRRWLLAEAGSDLESVRASEVPRAWRPVSTTTDEEALFVAPFEMATARGRASELFDFEYLWEAYKPASSRRWGYYTLPVLFGDSLVARIDLRYDRPRKLLRVLGFWPEAAGIRRDPAFANALGRALARLADFHGANSVAVAELRPSTLEHRVLGRVRLSREFEVVG
jgi:uncharacterized protein YcaQ